MTAKMLLIVGARLLAMYFAVTSLAQLLDSVQLYNFLPSDSLDKLPLYMFVAVAQALIFLAAAAVMLARYRLAAPDSDWKFMLDRHCFLAGMQLMGLYFLISGTSYLIASVATWLATPLFAPSASGRATLTLIEPWTRHVLHAIAGGLMFWQAPRLIAILSHGAPLQALDSSTNDIGSPHDS